MILAIVDLPEPDSPTNPKDSPSKISNETLLRAFRLLASLFLLMNEPSLNIFVIYILKSVD